MVFISYCISRLISKFSPLFSPFPIFSRCDFFNFSRNITCFQCQANRPPDELGEKQLQPRTRLDRAGRVVDVSNDWDLYFDDNELDGADVASFEFADLNNARGIRGRDEPRHERTSDSLADTRNTSMAPRVREHGRRFSDADERKYTVDADRTGFDDFDSEEEDGIDRFRRTGCHAHDVSAGGFPVSGTDDNDERFGLKQRKNRQQSWEGCDSDDGNDFGSGKMRESRTDCRSSQRNTFGRHDDGYDERRENNRAQRFDRRNGFGDGRGDDRFKRFDRCDDRNRRSGNGDRRGNDRRFDRSDDGNTFKDFRVKKRNRRFKR